MTKAKKENRAPKDEEQQLTNAELDTVNGGTRAGKAQSDISFKILAVSRRRSSKLQIAPQVQRLERDGAGPKAWAVAATDSGVNASA